MTIFTTPTGRLVWGDPFTAQVIVDDLTKQPRIDPATGKPMIEYAIGVAFAKTDPEWPTFREMLKAQDRAAWPQFHGPDGEIRPGVVFADKITDGDGFNTKGVPHANKDGYAGHWVVKFASRYAPTIHYFDHPTARWVQLVDPKGLKAGDYIRVNGSTQSNNSAQSPGMYRNFNMVALYGTGVAIVKGADPNETFTAPPPGAVTTTMVTAPPPGNGPAPVPPAAAGPSHVMLAAAKGATYEAMIQAGWTDETLVANGMMAAPVVTAPAAAPPPAPPAPAAPPPAPPAPAAPPPTPVRTMLPAAGGSTYEAMIAAGWTDATMIANGMMAA